MQASSFIWSSTREAASCTDPEGKPGWLGPVLKDAAFLCNCCYYSLVAKSCPTLATQWTMLYVACQAPLSMGFPQTEWVTIFFSRDLSDPGIKAASPALAGGFFTTEPSGINVNRLGIFRGSFDSMRIFPRMTWDPNLCVGGWVFLVVDESVKFWGVTQGDLRG